MSRQVRRDYFEWLAPRLPSGAGTHRDQIGTLTHDLIAEIASEKGGGAGPNEVLDVALKFDFGSYSRPTTMARKQRAITLSGVFFSRFGRPGWSFVGSEVIVGDVALDLLWEREGALEADEIKTGSSAAAEYRDEAAAQARSQAEAASECLGPAFRGVRLVLLKAPSSCLHVDPTGEWS